MSNLLTSGAFQIRKEMLFRIALISAAVAGVVFTIADAVGYDDMFIVPIHILIAVFVSLICGREYNDGTIRNKVICGHSKGSIYLATLILNGIVALLIAGVFLLVHAAMRITIFPINSVFTMQDWILAAVNFILGCLVYTAVFTLVSMLMGNRAIGSIINLALVVVVMFGAYQVEFQLCQPQIIEMETVESIPLPQEEIAQIKDGTYQGAFYQTTMDENGETLYFTENTTITTMENPRYVSSKPLRLLFKVYDNALPHGQINTYMFYITSSIRFSDQYEPKLDIEMAEQVAAMPLYSAATIIAVSLAGWVLFRKKELK